MRPRHHRAAKSGWSTSTQPRGREQRGTRPALVVSADKFNRGPAELASRSAGSPAASASSNSAAPAFSNASTGDARHATASANMSAPVSRRRRERDAARPQRT
ncbi:MAG: type II toxin-antitoxin system PemK/MazF family toxin [Longimicrobiaceae bacterium]